MDEFSPLAPSVTELVIQMYDAVPQQSLLDLAKQVKTPSNTKLKGNPTIIKSISTLTISYTSVKASKR